LSAAHATDGGNVLGAAVPDQWAATAMDCVLKHAERRLHFGRRVAIANLSIQESAVWVQHGLGCGEETM